MCKVECGKLIKIFEYLCEIEAKIETILQRESRAYWESINELPGFENLRLQSLERKGHFHTRRNKKTQFSRKAFEFTAVSNGFYLQVLLLRGARCICTQYKKGERLFQGWIYDLLMPPFHDQLSLVNNNNFPGLEIDRISFLHNSSINQTLEQCKKGLIYIQLVLFHVTQCIHEYMNTL